MRNAHIAIQLFHPVARARNYYLLNMMRRLSCIQSATSGNRVTMMINPSIITTAKTASAGTFAPLFLN